MVEAHHSKMKENGKMEKKKFFKMLSKMSRRGLHPVVLGAKSKKFFLKSDLL